MMMSLDNNEQHTFHLDDEIDQCGLSNRSTHALLKNGVLTVKDLLGLSEEDLWNFHSIGKKSVAEILAFKQNICTDESVETVHQDQVKLAEKLKPVLDDPIFCGYDDSIKVLHLSVRSEHCLMNAGILTVGKLSEISDDQLLRIRNLGNKSFSEISNIRNHLMITDRNADNDNDVLSRCDRHIEICELLTSKYHIPAANIAAAISQLPDGLTDVECARQIGRDKRIKSFIAEKVMKDISAYPDGIAAKDFVYQTTGSDAEKKFVEEVILLMLNERRLDYEESKISLHYPTVSEWISGIKDERDRFILSGRAHGKTLENVSEELGITRERVRQIESKYLRNKPRLKEDKYRYLFNEYYLSRDDFYYAFPDESDLTFSFLKMGHGKRGTQSIEDAMSDAKVSDHIKRGLQRLLCRNYLIDGNNAIPAKRPEIVKYFVRKECHQDTNLNDFVKKYDAFLRDHGFESAEELKADPQVYANMIAASRFALWKQWRTFRYYDVDANDYADFVQTINLPQFDHKEISTLKILRDNQELMREYDIHDEYELHDLLKKIWNQYGNIQVDFARMPTLRIGSGVDREQQILELLEEVTPINVNDFAKLYEEVYGVKAPVFISNLAPVINRYFHDGIYEIQSEVLSDEQYAKMKEVLTEECYSINRIRQIFFKLYPDDKLEKINAYTLKMLGFKYFSGYVIRSKYNSAHEYFEKLLDVPYFDVASVDHDVRFAAAFSGIYQQKRDQLSLIEYEEGKCISQNELAEKYGISKDDMIQLRNAMLKMIDPDTVYSIHYLKNHGLHLENTKFENWSDYALSSILAGAKDQIKSIKMGHVRVFCQAEQPTIYLLISQVFGDADQMKYCDLVSTFENQYGVHLKDDKVKTIIKDSDYYYDPIDKMIYRNYQVYAKISPVNDDLGDMELDESLFD